MITNLFFIFIFLYYVGWRLSLIIFFIFFCCYLKKKTHQSNGLDLDFTKKNKNQFSCLGEIKNDGIKIESKVK
jgi:hypothetical protein